MKKVVVILVMVLACVSAYAQSPRVEVALTDSGLGKTLVRKPKTLNDSTAQKALQRAIERAVIKAQVKGAVAADTIKDTKRVKAPKGTTATWLRAIFLNGPFPGESRDAYLYRLKMQSYPASQPFK